MKKLIKGILQLSPLVILSILLSNYVRADNLYTTVMMILSIAVGMIALRLADLGWNNIRRYFEERKKLVNFNVPWPECYDRCEIVKTLGVSECDNVCPEKKEEE